MDTGRRRPTPWRHAAPPTSDVPDEAATVRTEAGGPSFPVDDNVEAVLRPLLAASRGQGWDGDLLGDARVAALALGRSRLWVTCRQPAADQPDARGELRIGVKPLMNPALEERLHEVANLVADVGGTWDADSAWIDMVHVRQDWNRWQRGLPVYGLATWLRAGGATVDPTGLDVDVTSTDDGELIVLRVPPAEVGAGMSDAARAIVRELAARTTLADGPPLSDANPRLPPHG
jgi:hypothetical protein